MAIRSVVTHEGGSPRSRGRGKREERSEMALDPSGGTGGTPTPRSDVVGGGRRCATDYQPRSYLFPCEACIWSRRCELAEGIDDDQRDRTNSCDSYPQVTGCGSERDQEPDDLGRLSARRVHLPRQRNPPPVTGASARMLSPLPPWAAAIARSRGTPRGRPRSPARRRPPPRLQAQGSRLVAARHSGRDSISGKGDHKGNDRPPRRPRPGRQIGAPCDVGEPCPAALARPAAAHVPILGAGRRSTYAKQPRPFPASPHAGIGRMTLTTLVPGSGTRRRALLGSGPQLALTCHCASQSQFVGRADRI